MQLMEMSFRKASVQVKAVALAKGQGGGNSVVDCLCDSGAIGGSFIGKETLRSLRSCVLSRKPAEADEVTLADKQTQLKLEGKVLLKVQLPNSKGEWTTGYVWFYVIDKPLKMIIGLHDLQDKFVEVFIDLFRAGAQERARAKHDRRLDAISVNLDGVDEYFVRGWSGVRKYKDYVAANIAFHLDGVEPGSLVSPWESVDKDAPELEELEEPVNFAEFHRFMTMSSAEVDAEYEEDIQRHVSDGMLKNTRIRELLRGKGKGAFVHNGKWEGLKGLEPLWPEGQRGLELSWKEELVDQLRSKIKARPINPKLYAACKEEFERLRGYIYVDSSSEISSHLVVAYLKIYYPLLSLSLPSLYSNY